MTEKAFFWRFAMLPIVLPLVCIAIIWLLDDVVQLSGFFAGILTFLAASGVIGGVPYLVTIAAVFIYTRLSANAENNYIRLALSMPLIFTFFMHMSVLIISILEKLQNQRTQSWSFLQMNMEFLALDIISFIVASIYTVVGFSLLGYLRKKNKIQPTEQDISVR